MTVAVKPWHATGLFIARLFRHPPLHGQQARTKARHAPNKCGIVRPTEDRLQVRTQPRSTTARLSATKTTTFSRARTLIPKETQEDSRFPKRCHCCCHCDHRCDCFLPTTNTTTLTAETLRENTISWTDRLPSRISHPSLKNNNNKKLRQQNFFVALIPLCAKFWCIDIL